MQRQEGLWIQGVNAMVLQRQVYRVCASKLASDESLGHQHTGAVYHRRRKLAYFSTHICLREPGKSEDKADTMVPQRRDFRGVIDPLLTWRESIGHKRGRGGGVCKGKLQVPRQDIRAEAKELYETGVDGLLIKIAENGGLRVDAGVLDQGTK
ncbi:hypothetical protein BHM03_00017789 [Ensete ventricosum]|nr:hypothetical protein BHM03_00017789 [Ensete ventricosum]